jgi:hypothetical protein
VRTIIFIACGFLLWGACLAAARLILGLGAASMGTATVVFIAAWFIVAAINMAVGVLKAGYSFGEEFPIFLLIFALPVLLAIFVKWRWLGVLTRG